MTVGTTWVFMDAETRGASRAPVLYNNYLLELLVVDFEFLEDIQNEPVKHLMHSEKIEENLIKKETNKRWRSSCFVHIHLPNTSNMQKWRALLMYPVHARLLNLRLELGGKVVLNRQPFLGFQPVKHEESGRDIEEY